MYPTILSHAMLALASLCLAAAALLTLNRFRARTHDDNTKYDYEYHTEL
jgi:hypothetical protein